MQLYIILLLAGLLQPFTQELSRFVEFSTRSQRNSHEWVSLHRCRLTSSFFGDIIRSGENPKSLISGILHGSNLERYVCVFLHFRFVLMNWNDHLQCYTYCFISYTHKPCILCIQIMFQFFKIIILKITGIWNVTCVMHLNIILYYKTRQFGLKRVVDGKWLLWDWMTLFSE